MSGEYGTLFEMIDKRMGSIEEGVNVIKTDVAIVKDRQSGLINDMSEMKTTIYGNGQPGMVTKIALISQKVGWISAVIGGGVSLVATSIIAIFKGK